MPVGPAPPNRYDLKALITGSTKLPPDNKSLVTHQVENRLIVRAERGSMQVSTEGLDVHRQRMGVSPEIPYLGMC